MIEAYVRFGIDHSRYYDIMFILPTPKHNDYLGTPHEQLSEKEYRISMEIARLAEKTVREMYGRIKGKNQIKTTNPHGFHGFRRGISMGTCRR